MRSTVLLILLLTSTLLFGQVNTKKEIDLNIVESLINKATPGQVKATFGEASDEVISPTHALLLYKVGSKEYVFKFNEDKKLTAFVLDNKAENAAAQLSYSDVKEARIFTKKSDISKKLGQPTQVTIDNNNEVWYYKYGNEPLAEKVLIVNFDLLTPSIVKSYNYYADAHASSAVSSDILSSFTIGVLNLKEIEKKLGQPTKVIMNKQSEDWYYTSPNTTLIVYFDKESRLNDYLFKKESDK